MSNIKFVSRRAPIVDQQGVITRELQLYLQSLADKIDELEKKIVDLQDQINNL